MQIWLYKKADLILALGARFDDRVTGNIPSMYICLIPEIIMGLTKATEFAPQAKLAASQGRGGIVHFEIMPKNINKVVQATEAIEGDVAENLKLLLPYIEKIPRREEWFGQIADWKKRFPFDFDRDTSEGMIKPQMVIEELSNQTASYKENVIITTGVGQHQIVGSSAL